MHKNVFFANYRSLVCPTIGHKSASYSLSTWLRLLFRPSIAAVFIPQICLIWFESYLFRIFHLNRNSLSGSGACPTMQSIRLLFIHRAKYSGKKFVKGILRKSTFANQIKRRSVSIWTINWIISLQTKNEPGRISNYHAPPKPIQMHLVIIGKSEWNFFSTYFFLFDLLKSNLISLCVQSACSTPRLCSARSLFCLNGSVSTKTRKRNSL